MEFRLDDDQVDLQQTVARLFEHRFPLDAVNAREGAALDREAWMAAAELGIFGLLVDPDHGGSGLGVVEAALVFEQVGSHLVPGPFTWSLLGATVLDGDLRTGVIDGSLVVTGVDLLGAAPGGAATGVAVEHASDADLVLVAGEEGVSVIEGGRSGAGEPSNRCEPLDALDPSASVARLSGLDGGAPVAGPSVVERLRVVGSVLAAAELVGVASKALEVAQAYALAREQFGTPIGSFQAVKHMLADMYVAVTLAQSATYAAAAVVDRPGPGDDPAASVDAAAILAADAAIDGASTAVQVLGGMGFTWDMLPNHLLKRAWHVAQRFDAGGARAERLGRSLVGSER
jgi:alkylation response protein AidB-like acyl-CoA dehydrogenase